VMVQQNLTVFWDLFYTALYTAITYRGKALREAMNVIRAASRFGTPPSYRLYMVLGGVGRVGSGRLFRHGKSQLKELMK